MVGGSCRFVCFRKTALVLESAPLPDGTPVTFFAAQLLTTLHQPLEKLAAFLKFEATK